MRSGVKLALAEASCTWSEEYCAAGLHNRNIVKVMHQKYMLINNILTCVHRKWKII